MWNIWNTCSNKMLLYKLCMVTITLFCFPADRLNALFVKVVDNQIMHINLFHTSVS